VVEAVFVSALGVLAAAPMESIAIDIEVNLLGGKAQGDSFHFRPS
jgi:hypothetical protein